MQFRMQRIENNIVIMIEGKLLSEQETAPIREQINHELTQGSQKFIFDLKGIEFVNSACLNFLVSSKNLIVGRNGRIILCNVSDQLKKLLAVTKLESFFPMAARTSDAIAMLN
jgi:anti-sigma B factor antagonist